MPPKQKFTKDEILECSLNIIRKEGPKSLTARRLGEELGSSSRPIFTVFQSMEEVLSETINCAKELYQNYVKDGLSEEAPFRGVGRRYIKFAKDEPQLFRLLFMTETNSNLTLSNILLLIDDYTGQILEVVKNEYGLDAEKAKRYYTHLWIYSHGIATLMSTGVSNYDDNEITELLAEVGKALITLIKKGE